MSLRRRSSERGASLTEYAVLVAVIAVAAIPGTAFLEAGVTSSYEEQALALGADAPAASPSPAPGPGPTPSPDPTPGPGNQAPVAALAVSCVDLTCAFADQSSDPDGAIQSWAWDFGGDGASSTEQHPSHTYAAGGTYTVSLTVVDEDGASDVGVGQADATAPNQAPEADFEFACERLTCTFHDRSVDDRGIAARLWSFGAGATSVLSDPQHTFGAAGTYSVDLTVTDTDQVVATVAESVTIPKVTVSITGTGRRDGRSDNRTYAVVASAKDSNGEMAEGVTIAGSWSNGGGAGDCTTEDDGTCTIDLDVSSADPGARTFTVAAITHWAWDGTVPGPLTIAQPER